MAPDTIEPDVANIRDSMKSAEQGAGSSAGDPLAGLGSSLAASIMSMGSWEQFTQYVDTNCPIKTYDPGLYQAQQAAARAASNAAVKQAENQLAQAVDTLQGNMAKMQGLNWTQSWTVTHMQAAYQREREVLAQVAAVAARHDCTKTDAMINNALSDAAGTVPNIQENTPDADVTSSAATGLRDDTDNAASQVTYYEGPLQAALKSAPGAPVKVTVAQAEQLVTQAKALVSRYDQVFNVQQGQISKLETKAAGLSANNSYKLDQVACGG